MAKRETIGTRLRKAREELGLNVPQLREKILTDYRAEVGESTIRGIEKDSTPNPGIKTIEFMALGVGLDPLEVIGLGLGDPPELKAGFKISQIARFWEKYSAIDDSSERAFYDRQIRMLIDEIERWR